jgi:aspartyl-tRNA(Asn)/glutamyl-tRNA(Gln) amidotransferase subunit A
VAFIFRLEFTNLGLIVTRRCALIANKPENAMSKPLHWKTARQLEKGFRKAKFSAVDVAKAALAQVYQHDGALNAMCHLDEKTTLAMAEASAKRWKKREPLSPLDGVPVLIKDLLLTKGWPTRRGSKTVDPVGAWEVDAPSVARLREAGCVFLGLTTTPEFGWKGVTDSPLTGITRNPWNPALTPGGSSGGSSSALAAGYAPIALGTDGGGSIRIPAGFTGTFGLKPSFGRVPAYPLSPFGTVAHIGPMTRTVGDAAMMMNAIAQPDNRDWFSLPYDDVDYGYKLGRKLKGLRVAFSATLGYAEVDPEVAALVQQAVQVLHSLGAEVTAVDPGFEDPAQIFRTLWWSGAGSLLGGLPPDKKALLDPALADVVEQSKSITVQDIMAAHKARGELGTRMRLFMEDYDVLVTPTLPGVAFEAGKLQPDAPDNNGKWVNWTPFTYPFNLTQQPAASVPCGFTRAGLPVGLQVVGRMFDDRTVLKACAAFENATKHHKARPKGF